MCMPQMTAHVLAATAMHFDIRDERATSASLRHLLPLGLVAFPVLLARGKHQRLREGQLSHSPALGTTCLLLGIKQMASTLIRTQSSIQSGEHCNKKVHARKGIGAVESRVSKL